MGKCATRTKKIVKAIAKAVSPVGVALISDIVWQLESTDLTNRERRNAALAAIKVSFKEKKIEAGESAIRAVVEGAVTALKEGEDALRELGQPDHDDEAEIATA